MFDQFGEFDSAEEINETAEGLCNEGDIDSLYVVAKENGIDMECVRMYAAGDVPFLCDTFSAALGKLEVEEKDLKPKEIMEDWLDYIKVCCAQDEDMARAIRRKGKNLKGCLAQILLWSFKARYKVDADIVKQAGISARVEMGMPGMKTVKGLIREYYLGK